MFNQNLQITVGKREGWKEMTPFLFVDNHSYTKIRRLSHIGRMSVGYPVASIDSHHYKLSFALKRESSTSLQLSCLSWVTLKWLKAVTIDLPNTDINRKLILKCCGKKESDLLFYHESNGIIELRRVNTLKKNKSFSLQTICDSLGISSQYNEIKTYVDVIYVPQFLSIALSLGSTIVLADTGSFITIVYKSQEQRNMEKFVGLNYDNERKLLLAEGRTSIRFFQLEPDQKNWNTIKIIENPYFNRNSKLVAWDSSEYLIILAEKIALELENIHIWSYEGDQMQELGLIENKNSLKLNYSFQKRALLYIDMDYNRQKQLRCIWIDDLKKEIEASKSEGMEYNNIIEGEHLAYLPDVVEKMNQVRPNFFLNTLGINNI